jgi:two-component system, LytTR family, response regulator
MTPLTAVVCEDEPLARLHLRQLIEATPRLRWIAEAGDGASAVGVLNARRPDLVFLDIRMPEMDGLSVLQRLRYTPRVIFTTAYDAHAVQAFELGAVDYLLKPFGRDRFAVAVERAVRDRGSSAAPEPPVEQRLVIGDAPLTHLFARERGQIVPIAVSDIERLTAEDDYVAVYARGRRHLITITLTALLERLQSPRFLRIHRSHAVHADAIVSMTPTGTGRVEVTLRDGVRITASRSGTQVLRAFRR